MAEAVKVVEVAEEVAVTVANAVMAEALVAVSAQVQQVAVRVARAVAASKEPSRPQIAGCDRRAPHRCRDSSH